jgi:hypothetical protein
MFAAWRCPEGRTLSLEAAAEMGALWWPLSLTTTCSPNQGWARIFVFRTTGRLRKRFTDIPLTPLSSLSKKFPSCQMKSPQRTQIVRLTSITVPRWALVCASCGSHSPLLGVSEPLSCFQKDASIFGALQCNPTDSTPGLQEPASWGQSVGCPRPASHCLLRAPWVLASPGRPEAGTGDLPPLPSPPSRADSAWK